MRDSLNMAEEWLPIWLSEPEKWIAKIQQNEQGFALSAWRRLNDKYSIVCQLLVGDRPREFQACQCYAMRVVQGCCKLTQAVFLENNELEVLSNIELASGSVFCMKDPDGVHCLQSKDRAEDLLLMRICTTAKHDDYTGGLAVNQKNVAWLLERFRPAYG